MEANNKTFVVGDIHGANKALLQCIERSNIDKEKDVLISLGDIADGWSGVSECVDELLTFKNLIAIKGNHDHWCDEWLQFGIAPLIWTQQGGQATIDSYVRTGSLTDERHRHFFRKQHLYYIDDDNRAFVHGGYKSTKGLGHEQYNSDYYWDRDLWNTALSGSKSQSSPNLLKPHKEIYIGHTATQNWNKDTPMNASNVWNMDTGAGFSGKLTFMNIDTKEIFQSDGVKLLYPNEHGR